MAAVDLGLSLGANVVVCASSSEKLAAVASAYGTGRAERSAGHTERTAEIPSVLHEPALTLVHYGQPRGSADRDASSSGGGGLSGDAPQKSEGASSQTLGSGGDRGRHSGSDGDGDGRPTRSRTGSPTARLQLSGVCEIFGSDIYFGSARKLITAHECFYR